MKPAILYLRTSTEDQALSPHAQSTLILAYCKAHNLTPLATYLDRCSGGTPIHLRSSLPIAIEHAKREKAPIIIARSDRLARDTLISLTAHRLTPILSADNVANSDSPTDALLRTLLASVAEYERSLIRLRTKQALASLASQGKRTGTIPYGFSIDSHNHLIPDPQESHVISLIRSLSKEGHSQRKILEILHTLKIHSRAHTPFHLSQVQNILKKAPIAA